ncbi:PilZ domain-containing protein [bacterium]|nr:PilZ domain-containing protein [bacterium]
MDQERRQTERVQPILRVRTEVFSNKGHIHLAIFADILNISEEGICLQSPLELKTRDRLKIYLPRLDKAQPLIIQGEVMWIELVNPYIFNCGLRVIATNLAKKEEVKADIKMIIETYFKQKPWEFKT